MRICIVSLRSLVFHVAGVPGGGGGAEAQSTLLAETLARRGHEVSVVVTDYTPEHRRQARLTPLPLINAYDSDAGLPGLRFLWPRWAGVMRALRDADAEVYFQMCAGLVTYQCASFCRRHGRAFVFATASDSDVVPDRIRLSRRDRWLYMKGLRGADAVLTQHGRQAELLRLNFRRDSVSIPMGVRIPAGLPRPAQPPEVLWLGTLRPVKRPELWLKMAEQFPRVPFVMVGGPGFQPGYFDGIAARARGIPNVDFRGAVPAALPILERSWLLLNTSEVEGFPNTFLEAWARGIPTLSFFDPDGVVSRHGLGRIVEDEAGMVRSLGELLASREERDRLGRAGRSYVETRHAPERVAEAVEKVLESAVARARRRG